MAEEEESWQEFYENNRLVLPHASRRSSDAPQKASVGFCFCVKSIEGVRFPDSLVGSISVDDAEFQLRITFYDTANKCFYGSTWLGPVIGPSSHENGRFRVDCDEPLYFHSSLNDVTCVAAIEIVTYNKNQQGYSCGWSILRVFDRITELRNTSTPGIINRLPVHQGSLGALLFLPVQDALEEQISDQVLSGCFVSYTLQTHPPLEKVMHLMPENALIGGDDIVPGVLESYPDDSGFIDILKKPRLVKTCPCFINKLNVNFQPTVNEFEDNLLNDLNLDRLHRSSISPDDGLKVSIAERRLRVGVHNGWTFVGEPHMVYLEPEYEGGGSKSGRKSPLASQVSLTGSKISSLLLRSRLELRELVQHPLFAVVFEVEYVISEPFAQPLVQTKKKKTSLSGSLMRSQNQTVTVQWAVWVPFEEGQPEERETVLNLENGTIYPGVRMVYGNKLPQAKKPGTVRFTFNLQRKRSGSSIRSSPQGSQLLSTPMAGSQKQPVGSNQVPTYNSLHAGTGDVQHGASLTPGITGRPPLPGKPRGQDGIPVVTPRDPLLGGQRPSAPVPPAPISNLTEVPHSSLHTPLLLSGTVGGSTSAQNTLSRAGYARLSGAGYLPITDRHGNPPLVVDPSESVPLNLDHESMDSLQAHEIVIQFLALSRCYGHRSVFFTFQFYRFPQVTTERLYLKDSDSQNQGQLCVLQKFNKDGTLSNEAPGLVVSICGHVDV